jgi:hypothetical protein
LLGAGVAYGVDSRGEVVGDDQAELESPDYQGRPVLWRDGKAVFLSTERGTAYAIADSGVIVGTTTKGRWNGCHENNSGLSSAFTANARDARPRAQPIDPLVRNLGLLHVESAFGVAEDGRILACVEDPAIDSRPQYERKRRLAILVPRS